MALSEKEQQRVEFLRTKGLDDQAIMARIAKDRAGFPQVQTETVENEPSQFTEVAKGFGKGLAETAVTTTNALVEGGRFLQAGINPNKTLGDLRSEAASDGGSLFAGEKEAGVQQMLESQNPSQTAGKLLAFGAEVATPAVATKIPKLVGNSLNFLTSTTDDLAKVGGNVTERGMEVKNLFSDALAGLDDKVKTSLERTDLPTFESVVEQGQKAMADSRMRTPLETVGESIQEGLKQVQSQSRALGEAKNEILQSANVGFTKVGNIAQTAALDARRAFSGLKLDAGEQRAVESFVDELKKLGSNPRLQDVDATIDMLQDQLYKATRGNTIELTDRVTGRLRSILGKLNGGIQDIGGEAYKKANQEYSDAVTFMRELNARLGKEGASAGSFVKRLFSPADGRSKELFEQLQQYTGKDYFRDADLAKFVMDTLGDTRADSLLNQIPTSKTGAIGKAVDFVVDKLSDPLEAAKRFIQKTGPQSSNNAFGVVAGADVDEDGNFSFNPVSAAAGVALAGTLGKPGKVNVKTIAKNMDKRDRDVIANYLDNPDSLGAFTKVEGLLRATKVPDNASFEQIRDFFRAVLREYNG